MSNQTVSADQIVQLTEQWAQQANLLVYLHGENDPAAKAIQYCIASMSDLLIQPAQPEETPLTEINQQ